MEVKVTEQFIRFLESLTSVLVQSYQQMIQINTGLTETQRSLDRLSEKIEELASRLEETNNLLEVSLEESTQRSLDLKAITPYLKGIKKIIEGGFK